MFDQTGVNEHGLRSTLKKTSSIEVGKQSLTSNNRTGFFQLLKSSEDKKVVGFSVEDTAATDRDPKPYESAEVNTNTFLFKLNTTMQRIEAYKEHIGLNKGERRMKM